MPDDKPIIIRGGSVEITFDGNDFEDASDPADPRKPKKWKHKKDRESKVVSVRIENGSNKPQDIPLERNCKITVMYQDTMAKDDKKTGE